MKAHVIKQEPQNIGSKATSNHNNTFSYQRVYSGPEAVQMNKLRSVTGNTPQARQMTQLLAMANDHAARQFPIQKKQNKTGMPDQLKSGIENLSGMDMSDVKVHYNSSQPAQLNAHAYAQGTSIHIAPGQERHLPHEAWHVVQQKQGRVKPTMQMKGKVNINDDKNLEKEADVMGARAVQLRAVPDQSHSSGCGCPSCTSQFVQRKEKFVQMASKESEVAQLNCKHCGSPDHTNKNCPTGGKQNTNHQQPVKVGKGERDLRKRDGHGMMSKEQAKRYVPKYKK